MILCILKGEMHFKMHYLFFFRKKIFKKMCVPTLPEIFRPLTRNTLNFLFGPSTICYQSFDPCHAEYFYVQHSSPMLIL